MDVCVDLQARSLGARAWCGLISLSVCRACADWETGLWHWAVCLFVWALPRELRAGGSADGASCHMCTRHSRMLWVVVSSPPSYPSTTRSPGRTIEDYWAVQQGVVLGPKGFCRNWEFTGGREGHQRV